MILLFVERAFVAWWRPHTTTQGFGGGTRRVTPVMVTRAGVFAAPRHPHTSSHFRPLSVLFRSFLVKYSNMSAEEVGKAFVQHYYQTFDTAVDNLAPLFVSFCHVKLFQYIFYVIVRGVEGMVSLSSFSSRLWCVCVNITMQGTVNHHWNDDNRRSWCFQGFFDLVIASGS